MEINKLANLSPNESTIKLNQVFDEPEVGRKQQTEFVSSPASQASRAYASAQISKSKNINFEGKYDKIAQTIIETTCPSKVHLSFEEVTCLLERMGYEVESGKGSHCTVNIPNARPLTIVRPHGDHKSVDPGTIKDLKALLSK